MLNSKIVPFEGAENFFSRIRQEGRRIVQSHGVFDLVHPGHILHLEEARSFGDLLVVTLSADAFVGKGPGRPYFNEGLRVQALAALSCVDHIVVVPHFGPEEAIRCVKPAVYCKGKEYQESTYSADGSLQKERTLVEESGGEMRFAGGVKYSSTKLLNLHFDHLGSEVRSFCARLSQKYNRHSFSEAVRSLEGLRVLVMGDTIFDRYTEVAVQGLTSKNRILSSRFLREETHPGGALAVFRHVREFTSHVRYFSLTGTEDWAMQAMNAIVPADQNYSIRTPQYTTVLKQRYVEPSPGEGVISKLFSVNYLTQGPPPRQVLEELQNRAHEALQGVDAVLLTASLNINPDDAQMVEITFRPAGAPSFDFSTSA